MDKEVIVNVEVHCYRGVRLADDIFESSSLYFIGKTEADKIKKNRHMSCVFLYDKNTTLDDFRNKILFDLFEGEEYTCTVRFRVVGKNNWLFYIDNQNITFENILSDNLISIKNNQIKIKVFVSYNAGSFDIEDSLRYYMHSNENGLEPHVHVNVLYSDYSVSIPILHPEDYTGNMPNKYLKKAINKVKRERKKMLEFWNAHTNGLRVDINQALGIVDY
jgi:hypothetical protein